MDFQSLKDQVSNLSLYDIKAGVRKVQNAVMNFTEMEAKVREATNNEPWGASSTLMQEIANGTHSYQLLNEIMPMIYKRFTEKTAEEWRQIYKALQLLEFLIKNGSERVVDDARSHMSLLKMLRQFHYIDKNGKDQGINVRNRSQELVKLLSDVDQIRAERKKARANRHKFGGFEGGSGFGPGFSSSGRYGGFGSESASYGGYSGGVFGDGGGFGGSSMDYGDSTVSGRSGRFEEYDEGDDVSYGAARSPSSGREHRRTPTASTSAAAAAKKKREPEKKAPEPVQDLFDFGDDEPVAAPAAIPAPSTSSVAAGKQPAAAQDLTAGDDDDEFAEFQSAPSAAPAATTTSSQPFSPIQIAAPQSISTAQLTPSAGLMGMTSPTSSTAAVAAPSSSTFNTTSSSSALPPLSIPSVPAAPQQQTSTPSGYQPKQPNYFTSTTAPISSRPSVFSNFSSPATEKPSPFTANSAGNGAIAATATGGNATSRAGSIGSKPSGAGGSASNDVFGSLWNTASASAGIKSNKPVQPQGPKLSSLAKEKASAGIWGAATGGSMAGGRMPSNPGVGTGMGAQTQGQGQGQSGQKLGNGLDDLLG